MTATAAAEATLRRNLFSPRSVLLLVLAAAAWLLMAARNGTDMSAARSFLPAWALMMTAMMLPAVAPVASLYVKTLGGAAPVRLVGFLLGYLSVWTVTAVPAYGMARLMREAVVPHPWAVRLVGAAIFAGCGAYQLSTLKGRCLRHCRSPLAQLMEYAGYTGRARDLRVGLRHAGYCLGCCWALMLLLFAFGAMSLVAALGLTGLVVAEKLAPRGELVARASGALALGLAVATLAFPNLVPGLEPMAPMG